MQRRQHTNETRAQLAAWDNAVAAWRRAGMDVPLADGYAPAYGELGDEGAAALDAAINWFGAQDVESAKNVHSPCLVAYGD